MGQNYLTLEVECRGMILDKASEDSFRRKLLKLMAARYRAFLLRRFNTNSRGGGDWPPLADVTQKRRRKGKPIRRTSAEQVSIEKYFQKQSILVDTGLLRSALNVTPSAASFEAVSVAGVHASVAVGFSNVLHPPSPKKPKGRSGTPKLRKPVTVTQLAYIHHFGSKERKLPARPILVPPDENCIRKLEKLIEKELKKQYELD